MTSDSAMVFRPRALSGLGGATPNRVRPAAPESGAEELTHLDARARDGQRRSSLATRSLAEEFRDLRAVVLAIDAHVVALAGDYPELAAAWKSQRPIGKRLGRPTPRKVAARKKRARASADKTVFPETRR